MKYLKCCEICKFDCEHVAKGKTERAVILDMFKHGENRHHQLFQDMNDDFREKLKIKMYVHIEDF